jgi:hypothetical protein
VECAAFNLDLTNLDDSIARRAAPLPANVTAADMKLMVAYHKTQLHRFMALSVSAGNALGKSRARVADDVARRADELMQSAFRETASGERLYQALSTRCERLGR